jgi:hypothetical protein
MAVKSAKGGGQGRVRTMLGHGRMLRCADTGCERAIFAGRGTALELAGAWSCGMDALVPKARVGQRKQR